jgi:hypothetical protein
VQPAMVGACEFSGVHGEAGKPAAQDHHPAPDASSAAPGHECCEGDERPAPQDETDPASGCCVAGALCGAPGTGLAAIPVAFETADSAGARTRPLSGGIGLLLPALSPPFRPPIS